METHSKLDPSEVHISLLQPVIEVLGIVSGVTLTIRGHAEDYQGLVDLRQAAQVGLERQGCHHCGLTPQVVASGKPWSRQSPMHLKHLKGSLEMEDLCGRRVEWVEEKEWALGEREALREDSPYRDAFSVCRAGGLLLMNMGAKEATPGPTAPPFYCGCFVHYTEPCHVREWRQAVPGE